MGLAAFFNFLVTIYCNVSEVVAKPMKKKTQTNQQNKQTGTKTQLKNPTSTFGSCFLV